MKKITIRRADDLSRHGGYSAGNSVWNLVFTMGIPLYGRAYEVYFPVKYGTSVPGLRWNKGFHPVFPGRDIFKPLLSSGGTYICRMLSAFYNIVSLPAIQT